MEGFRQGGSRGAQGAKTAVGAAWQRARAHWACAPPPPRADFMANHSCTGCSLDDNIITINRQGAREEGGRAQLGVLARATLPACQPPARAPPAPLPDPPPSPNAHNHPRRAYITFITATQATIDATPSLKAAGLTPERQVAFGMLPMALWYMQSSLVGAMAVGIEQFIRTTYGIPAGVPLDDATKATIAGLAPGQAVQQWADCSPLAVRARAGGGSGLGGACWDKGVGNCDDATASWVVSPS